MIRYQAELAVESVRPWDDEYDAAARVFFRRGAPALIVRPRAPEEVAAALAHAESTDLAISVRSGGHSLLGHGTNSAGLVIDLRHLSGVEVLDPARRLVRVGGGATWGPVAAELGRHGWALTSGDTAGVGVGGLTLGGGIGWLVRRYGLAIDNLVGARVVTADGRLLTASATQHADLFWALRGGGGNFGVVVDFDFVAQPVPTVHFGRVVYPRNDTATLVRRWRDAMRAAPDELSSTLALMPGAATVLLCYGGDPGTPEADVDAILDPLLTLGPVVRADLAERSYADVLEPAEPLPAGRMTSRNVLVPELGDDVITALEQQTGPVMVRSLGGAFGRVPPDATAFAHRDAEALVVGAIMLPGAATDAELAAALAPWQQVARHGTGTYLNFQGSATPEDLALAYPPDTYARLATVKAAYDPENRFAHNHNVVSAPRGAGTAR